jgi:hypothetical protein
MKYSRKIIFIVLVSGYATLLSCGTWESYYRKESVHNTVILSNYKNDTLYLGFISSSGWVAYGYKDPNKIEIPKDTILAKVINAFAKLNLTVDVSGAPEYFELTNKMREFRTGTQFRDSLMGKLPPNKSWLVPYVEYTVLRSRQLEAGAASHTVFDTGRDELSILTRLHFAILRNDSLMYYSGHMHRDTLTRLRHEPFQPSLSQSVFDSLAALSMEEYIKRLE